MWKYVKPSNLGEMYSYLNNCYIIQLLIYLGQYKDLSTWLKWNEIFTEGQMNIVHVLWKIFIIVLIEYRLNICFIIIECADPDSIFHGGGGGA